MTFKLGKFDVDVNVIPVNCLEEQQVALCAWGNDCAVKLNVDAAIKSRQSIYRGPAEGTDPCHLLFDLLF